MAEISVTLECVDMSSGQKPEFTSQIQSLEGLKDGQSAHFECTLVPVGDPNLKVYARLLMDTDNFHFLL